MGREMTLMARMIFGLMMLFASAVSANAHALEPGYLDLRQLTPETWQVFWRKPDVQGAPMAIEARLPPICAPDQGLAPTSDGAAWVSGWVADCSSGLVGGQIAIVGLSAQRTDVLLRLQPLDQAPTTVRLTPDVPTHLVLAEPTTGEVFLSYLMLGFEHIIEGWDHLLFVFALMVLIRDPWSSGQGDYRLHDRPFHHPRARGVRASERAGAAGRGRDSPLHCLPRGGNPQA